MGKMSLAQQFLSYCGGGGGDIKMKRKKHF